MTTIETRERRADAADTAGTAVDNWLPVLRIVAAVIVVAALLVQLVFARDVIPPLDAIAIAFVVGAIVARRRPRAGAITMGAASVAYVLGSGPFDAPNIVHPDSVLPFLVATTAMVSAVIGIVGFVAVLSQRAANTARTAAAIGGAVVGIAVVVGIVAWTTASSTPVHAGDVAVRAHNVAYQPKAVQAAAGTVAVRVSNGDFVRHTFVVDDLHVSLSIPAGKAKRVAFPAQPGRYRFHCDIKGHENMEGTLVVS